MLQNKQLAIISKQSLSNLGLKQLLCDYFSASRVNTYNQADAFMSDIPEKFDFYFVQAETFLLYNSFFLPRKNKTILLTSENNPEHTFQNFTYQLCLNNDIDQLIEQLQHIIETACQRSASENQGELSHREIDVLQLLAQGYINKEIAEQLNISFNTVLTHRKNITSKLGIKTVSGLSFYAMMNGYITPGDIE